MYATFMHTYTTLDENTQRLASAAKTHTPPISEAHARPIYNPPASSANPVSDAEDKEMKRLLDMQQEIARMIQAEEAKSQMAAEKAAATAARCVRTSVFACIFMYF